MPDNQLYLMIGRLEGKLDYFLNKSEAHDKKFEEHEARLDDLENTRTITQTRTSMMVTGLSLVAGSIGAVAAHIFKWITS